MTWQHMRRPVVPLLRAMYGHTRSGTFWEGHCNESVDPKGVVAMVKSSWPGRYYHPRLRRMVVIYLDDLKLAGPAVIMAEGWTLIHVGLDNDDPSPVDVFLGCPQ